jgi:hypothetical protein
MYSQQVQKPLNSKAELQASRFLFRNFVCTDPFKEMIMHITVDLIWTRLACL